MKASTAIVALAGVLSATIQGTTAECYRTGDQWPRLGGTDEALQFVEHACRANGGIFTGYYEPGQTKRMCPVSKNSPYISEGFEVQNLNTREGFDLDNTDCFNRLKNEILDCSRGGQSAVSAWRFKADPGNC